MSTPEHACDTTTAATLDDIAVTDRPGHGLPNLSGADLMREHRHSKALGKLLEPNDVVVVVVGVEDKSSWHDRIVVVSRCDTCSHFLKERVRVSVSSPCLYISV